MHPRLHRRTNLPQRGFTLVEQLAAVAVAGTLSVAALPGLVALEQQAQSTALASLAASAGAAMVLNQAGCMVTDQQASPGKCQPVRDCADVAGLLMTGLPAGYQVQAQPLPAQGGVCTLVRQQDGGSARFPGAAAGG